MQIREHVETTEKMLRQAAYYTRWYCCMNHKCRTTLVMPEEHRVYTADQVTWGDSWADTDRAVSPGVRPIVESDTPPWVE